MLGVLLRQVEPGHLHLHLVVAGLPGLLGIVGQALAKPDQQLLEVGDQVTDSSRLRVRQQKDISSQTLEIKDSMTLSKSLLGFWLKQALVTA